MTAFAIYRSLLSLGLNDRSWQIAEIKLTGSNSAEAVIARSSLAPGIGQSGQSQLEGPDIQFKQGLYKAGTQ